jgi:hypothetical protein
MKTFRSHPSRRGYFRRRTFKLFLVGGIAMAASQPTAAVGDPLVLSDRQLDHVTAGAAGLQVDLAAVAQGSAATAYTTGTVRSVDTSIQLVQVSTKVPGDMALIGNVPATLFFANGGAAAAGSTSADCSGSIETSGSFAYLIEASARLQTSGSAGFPIAVNCNCAAFGIALNQH